MIASVRMTASHGMLTAPPWIVGEVPAIRQPPPVRTAAIASARFMRQIG